VGSENTGGVGDALTSDDSAGSGSGSWNAGRGGSSGNFGRKLATSASKSIFSTGLSTPKRSQMLFSFGVSFDCSGSDDAA